MALIWAEGFDHYGTSPNGGRDAMLSGLWAEVSGGANLNVTTALSRTGSSSFTIAGTSSITTRFIRRVLDGGPFATVGLAFGLNLAALPSDNSGVLSVQFRDNANNPLFHMGVNSDGSITARIGNHAGSVIATTDSGVLVTNAFQHVEVKVTFDSVVGEVEIRVNNVPELQEQNLNLGNTGAGQVVLGRIPFVSGNSPTSYWDDLIAWNSLGAINNDFFGPQRVILAFASGDTAQDDWTFTGAASGAEAIDEVPPDGDTSYIQAISVGDISEYTMPTLPSEAGNISAVYIPAMAKISDAGTGNLQVSLVSDGDVAAGADHPLTTAYTYYGDVFQVNPATGNKWGKSALEDALLKVEKTA